MDKKPAIICKDLDKTYGEGENAVHAIRGVDLTINYGELRMLMGPSGSGKTTLISIISGILSPSSGICIVDDVNLQNLTDQERTFFRGKNIGFAFQSFNLIPIISNEENISIPLLINGVPRAEALERSKDLLKEFGMEEKIGVLPRDLSGGQQQRVAIARALVHNPKFIVCDEPTSFLDHVTGEKIMELIKEQVETKKMTAIVVTHDQRITHFADKIDRLEDGKIVS